MDQNCEQCKKAYKLLDERLPFGAWIVIFVVMVFANVSAWNSLHSTKADFLAKDGSSLTDVWYFIAVVFLCVAVALDIVLPCLLIHQRGFRRFLYHFHKSNALHAHLEEPGSGICLKEKVSGIRGRSAVTQYGFALDQFVLRVHRRGDSVLFDLAEVDPIRPGLPRQRLVVCRADLLLAFIAEADEAGQPLGLFWEEVLTRWWSLEAMCLVFKEVTGNPAYIRSPYGRFLLEAVEGVTTNRDRFARQHPVGLALVRERLIPLADRLLVHRRKVKAEA